jgi:hypothetical protein
VKTGDAFYIRDRSVDTHLWVVVSDTEKDPDRVVMISITTFEDHKEAACIVSRSDHPRINHKSCVAYNEARMTTLVQLNTLEDGGLLSVQSPVSDELLTRIREGVSKSMRIKPKFIDILLEQEVIE